MTRGLPPEDVPPPLLQVNTERFTYLSVGMFHQEGGWPKDVDPTEKEQTQYGNAN